MQIFSSKSLFTNLFSKFDHLSFHKERQFTPLPVNEKYIWCVFQLVSSSPTEVKATHTTPVKKYVDDLMMTFQQSGSGCVVKVRIPCVCVKLPAIEE